MFAFKKSKPVSLITILLVATTTTIIIPLLPSTMYVMAQYKTSNNVNDTNNSSALQSIQQPANISKNNTSHQNNNVIYRGISSSEPGPKGQLDIQRIIILPHRLDGQDYTGVLTFTATKPVEVLFGHRLSIDNNTLTTLDAKKFGSLFFITPAQHTRPNSSNVLSAPTVIKPDYKESAPPYYSASIPFVSSSVVLRTLDGIPFIAVYEVNAQIRQPQENNNLTTALSSISINITK
jgi:hypothetical protein